MLNTIVNWNRLKPESTWVCTLNVRHTIAERNCLTSYSYVEYDSQFKSYTLFSCIHICTIYAYMFTMMVWNSIWSTYMLCISEWYVFHFRWGDYYNLRIKHNNLIHIIYGDISRSIRIITVKLDKKHFWFFQSNIEYRCLHRYTVWNDSVYPSSKI